MYGRSLIVEEKCENDKSCYACSEIISSHCVMVGHNGTLYERQEIQKDKISLQLFDM